MFELIAHNEQGASVVYRGDTKKEVIQAFDSEYTRSGFVITIHNIDTGNYSEFKKTYR